MRPNDDITDQVARKTAAAELAHECKMLAEIDVKLAALMKRRDATLEHIGRLRERAQ